MATERVTDDLDRLLDLLPKSVRLALSLEASPDQLLEVVLDLGRIPEARYPGRASALGDRAITREDLADVVVKLGRFGADNRAGIERTLHRISAIRNRQGEVVGLTCRVGRAVFGTVAMVRDLLDSAQSLLLMGRPGVGKTTALREITRVLADEMQRRVVVIDTSNEIAGDGDIPHPAIGRARRMQVSSPEHQHQVMIEAVENHMPEVIVIDEIGTELEAMAARTIAERGVMLVATAHGNALANLIKNPTLSDLVGGIQSVTLGDEEARRRRTQKTVLERAAEPTFPIAVEMHSRHRWAIHADVASTVDQLLRGQQPRVEQRELTSEGGMRRFEPEALKGPVRRPPGAIAASPLTPPSAPSLAPSSAPIPPLLSHADSLDPQLNDEAVRTSALQVLCCGITPQLVEQAIRRHRWSARLVDDLCDADVVLSVRQGLGRASALRRQAKDQHVPILVIKADTLPQIERALDRLLSRQASASDPNAAVVDLSGHDDELAGLEECRLAIEQVVMPQGRPVELVPRTERVRGMQAELVNRYRLRCDVFGQAEHCRLRVFPP